MDGFLIGVLILCRCRVGNIICRLELHLLCFCLFFVGDSFDGGGDCDIVAIVGGGGEGDDDVLFLALASISRRWYCSCCC